MTRNSMDAMFQWMFSPDNPKLLILMRGLPSSGKSFTARQLCQGDESIIFSADDFFGTTPEQYRKNWAGHLLRSAHNHCTKQCKMLMQRQEPLAIIDNTNIVVRDLMPFFELAVHYQYKVRIQESNSPWWINDIAPYLSDKKKNREHLLKMAKFLWEKNQLTHGVPLANIEKLMFKYHTNVTVEQLSEIYLRNLLADKDN